jgi:hypothetical protein
MQSRAGGAAYRREFILVGILVLIQAVLDVEVGIGADEDKMSHPLFVEDLQSDDLIQRKVLPCGASSFPEAAGNGAPHARAFTCVSDQMPPYDA